MRSDEPVVLQVTEHARRPTGLTGGGSDGQGLLHSAEPYQKRVKVLS